MKRFERREVARERTKEDEKGSVKQEVLEKKKTVRCW